MFIDEDGEEAPETLDAVDQDFESPDDEGSDQEELTDGDGAEGDDDLIPSFGDEPEGAAAPEADTPLVRTLRNQLRETQRENRQLKRTTPQPRVELGPKPKFEDFDYDEEKFNQATDDWYARKAVVDRENEQRAAEQRQVEEQGNAILSAYQDRAKKLPVSDFDAAHQYVSDELGEQRASIIIAGSDDAEKLIYALYKSPAKLEALQKIENPIRFAFAAAALQKDLKTMKRRAPAPDTPIRSNAGNDASASDKRLAKLEAEADRTGDRTKVVAYKRQLRAAAH